MANLTIAVPDEVLRKARLRALEQGTSVNAILRAHLDRIAGLSSEQTSAVARIIERSRASTASRGQRTWTRDELHER